VRILIIFKWILEKLDTNELAGIGTNWMAFLNTMQEYMYMFLNKEFRDQLMKPTYFPVS
jgi:hypothetical protein